MTEPAIYRRRSELVEAVQVTERNIADLADMLHGRVGWQTEGHPILLLPRSIQPARPGDYAVHRLTSHDPWYPMRGQAFTDAYEPACPACAQVR